MVHQTTARSRIVTKHTHTPPTLHAFAAAALMAGCALPIARADEGDSSRETLGVASSVTLPPQSNGKPPSWTGKAFRQGVVTAANPYGAEAGAKILEAGGNAIDAAVAVAYALNVVEPQSAGIGGGGFMMIHMAEGPHKGRTFTIDSREKAPALAAPGMFVGVPNASLQGVAVGVPGMVRGTAWAVEKYGRLPLAQSLQPAIALADQGYAATARYAAVSCTARSRNSPEAEAFFCPGGAAPVEGSLVVNKALAETLRLIATHGADCFYLLMPDKGCDIAKGIVEGQAFAKPGVVGGQTVPGKGGSMSYADLAAYQPAERAPVEGSYRGYRIKSMASPSSGGLTVIQMLKMLERFPIGDASQGLGFGQIKTVNLMADAMRIAFADRAVWMGDADFVAVPAKGLLAPGYALLRGNALTPGMRAPNPVAGDPRPYDVALADSGTRLALAQPEVGPGGSTTHFSVVDQWGNMVSYTNTIESAHGIGVFAGYKRADGSFRNHGFLLNNELTDFNTAPGLNAFTGGPAFNDVQPNKRPRSSMAPTMLFTADGTPIAAYGSPGGATIINSVLNITLNLIDHKMGLQEAIDAPRVSAFSGTGAVSLESGFPQSLVDAMSALGYTTNRADVGSVQAVLVDRQTAKQYGGADRRREGTVVGLPRPQGK
jgi:gamma-glutamyltranspeptidase / glutathione hydrolase